MKIINLLPKTKQRELRDEKFYYSLVRFAAASAITLAIVLATQFLTRLYVKQQDTALDTEIEQVKRLSNKQENAALKQRITAVNSSINDFTKLAHATPAWSRVLAAFAAQVPVDMTVDSFQADLVKKQVDIRGTSPSREAVIQLYSNISQDDKEFFDIDYPLENVQRPTNVTFHFTFFIRDPLLLEQNP